MTAWRRFHAVSVNVAQGLKECFRWCGRLLKVAWLGVRRLVKSARAWALFILLIIAALVTYYVMADLYTPFTTDAYVQAYVVQVAPRVDGQVVRICVEENQAV